MRVKGPADSPSKNSKAQTDPTKNPLSPRERVRGNHNTPSVSNEQGGDNEQQDRKSSPSCISMSVPDDDKPDYYIEPPSPEIQAAFDHEMRIETGGYPEGGIPDEPPPPPSSAYVTFEAELKRIREAAARDGVPVLPNPLADRFRRPNIRGP